MRPSRRLKRFLVLISAFIRETAFAADAGDNGSCRGDGSGAVCDIGRERFRFRTLPCNNDIDKVDCSDPLSVLVEQTPEGEEVKINCGKCVLFDIEDGTTLTIGSGLNIEGKLLVPETANGTLSTPHVFVQGVFKVEPPWQGHKFKVLLTGTDDQFLRPHSHNEYSCARGRGCNVGKKAIVVAGGRLDVRGLWDPSCWSWTHLQDVVDCEGELTVGEGTFESYPQDGHDPVWNLLDDFEPIWDGEISLQEEGGTNKYITLTKGSGYSRAGMGILLLHKECYVAYPTYKLTFDVRIKNFDGQHLKLGVFCAIAEATSSWIFEQIIDDFDLPGVKVYPSV